MYYKVAAIHSNIYSNPIEILSAQTHFNLCWLSIIITLNLHTIPISTVLGCFSALPCQQSTLEVITTTAITNKAVAPGQQCTYSSQHSTLHTLYYNIIAATCTGVMLLY